MLLRDRCSSAGEIEESHMSSSIVSGTSFSFPFLDGLLAVLPEAFLRLCCPEAELKSDKAIPLDDRWEVLLEEAEADGELGGVLYDISKAVSPKKSLSLGILNSRGADGMRADSALLFLVTLLEKGGSRTRTDVNSQW